MPVARVVKDKDEYAALISSAASILMRSRIRAAFRWLLLSCPQVAPDVLGQDERGQSRRVPHATPLSRPSTEERRAWR